MLTDSLCKLQARWRLPERLVVQEGVEDVVPQFGGPVPLETALKPILHSACRQGTHQQGWIWPRRSKSGNNPLGLAAEVLVGFPTAMHHFSSGQHSTLRQALRAELHQRRQ